MTEDDRAECRKSLDRLAAAADGRELTGHAHRQLAVHANNLRLALDELDTLSAPPTPDPPDDADQS